MTLFTILTFNMQCSVNGTQHERILQLVETIKSKKYECICLQDVNLTSLSILKSKLDKYSLVESLSNGVPQIIFFNNNFKLKEEFCYSLPSDENREIIGCKLTYKEKEFEILNVWLENESEIFRQKQLEVLMEVSSSNTIIVGDFNIFKISEPANTIILDSQMCDAWITGGCNPQLRDTTFYENQWCRSVMLLYFKNNYSITCNGLLNNNCDKSAVSYQVKFVQ